MRAVFWLALIVLIVLAVRKQMRMPGPRDAAGTGSTPSAREAAVETMLCCAHCQVHFPASEATQCAGHVYCSDAHARLGPIDRV